MYLVRNKFTKDYIDKNGDWTQKKELAKRFSTNAEARSYIDSESEGVMKYVYPQQMEVIKESTTMKTFREFYESKKIVKEDWWDEKDAEQKRKYIETHPNSKYAQDKKLNKEIDSSVKDRERALRRKIKIAQANVDGFKKRDDKSSQSKLKYHEKELSQLQQKLNNLLKGNK